MTRLRAIDPAPAPADRAAWIEAGRALTEQHSEASWEFADWLAEGHRAFGKDALREAAEACGKTPGKIRNYLRVSNTYPNDRRRSTLGFSHHMEVAGLPEDTADALLDQAVSERWSRDAIRTAAREASLAGKVSRQAAEIRALKRALKSARSDPRDVVRQAKARLDSERRIVREAVNAMAGLVDELAAPETLDGLHGNARDIRRVADRLADDIDYALMRMKPAVESIEGGAGDGAA